MPNRYGLRSDSRTSCLARREGARAVAACPDEATGVDPDGDDDDLEPSPPYWQVRGGTTLGLPWWLWKRHRRRPWFPRFAAMVRRSRPAGTLRHKKTGRRYPLYRGRIGGRRMLVVTRGRGGMRREIVAIQPELELNASVRRRRSTTSPSERWPKVRAGRLKLRLPHSALHAVLARWRPEQLRRLAGGGLSADPTPAVVRGIAHIARRARRMCRWRSGGDGEVLEVFATPGYRLLVRRTSPREGEIVMLSSVAG
jgi:hypothetical protein